MTIENLKTLAADLYKKAEEAIPIVGGADKKEWMADRLEQIVEAQEPALDCLLGYETTSEVLDFLEKEYDERKEDIVDKDYPCASSKGDMYDTETSVSARKERDQTLAASDRLQDPTIIIEEDILIIEEVDPEQLKKTSKCSIDR